ncbi:MAG: hypothetical protein IPK13_23515 [Deltaproteobacteria bacterium]|nr:hypothetical protein [Deltaproteobacteria bacterium]
MLVPIPAFVSTATGGFEASILSLTTTTLGLLAPVALPVGTRVSVTFFSVALDGWVSRADVRDPRVFQVDFSPSREARRLIEERLRSARFPQPSLDWGEPTAPMQALGDKPHDRPGPDFEARFGDDSTESTEPSHPAVFHLPDAASEDISVDVSSSELDLYPDADESGLSFNRVDSLVSAGSFDSADSFDSLAGFDSVDSVDSFDTFDPARTDRDPGRLSKARTTRRVSNETGVGGFGALDSMSLTVQGADDVRSVPAPLDPSRDMDGEETLSVGVDDPVAQMTARVDELEDVLMAMYSDAEDTDSTWDEGEPGETVRSGTPVRRSRS